MKYYILAFILITVVLAVLPGCGSPQGEIKIDTDFERMLGYVPYEFSEEYPVMFGNPGKAKEIYDIEDITSYEDVVSFSDDERRNQVKVVLETHRAIPDWALHPELLTLAGFDGFMFDRIISIGNAPPGLYYIIEGSFDEELITGKLIEQGYSKQEYGQYEYYAIRGDFELGLEQYLGRIAMSSLNRVAVLDDMLVTSPATDVISGIFDTMDGSNKSIIDNPACLALADSLGDVLLGVICLPETIIYVYPNESNAPNFDFQVPADWEKLNGYGMAALGYRAEGDDRYFDIALYYDDSRDAESDGELIIIRMWSYSLYTWLYDFENIPFTERYEPGEPVITSYPQGAVLKISCRLIPEGKHDISMLMGAGGIPIRDLLFLAPDPSPYIGENE